MRLMTLRTGALAASLTTLTACGGPPVGEALERAEEAVCVHNVCTGDLPVLDQAPALPHSFRAPEARNINFDLRTIRGSGGGDGAPELVEDIDSDGDSDVVVFGREGIWLGVNRGTSDLTTSLVRSEMGYDQGWRTDRHVRTLADVDGDGRLDVVGFGAQGVWLGRGFDTPPRTGFLGPDLVLADFGYDQGWRVGIHERLLADVDGDGRADIVAFGTHGVWLARSTGAGFATPQLVLSAFGTNQGWTAAQHVRTLGDIDADGRADIVGFGPDGVWAARSTGAGFGALQLVVVDFGYNQGWRVASHVRRLAHLNSDARIDIVAFGDQGMWTAMAGNGGFGTPRLAIADFAVQQGWRSGDEHPRFVADLNDDGYTDVVGVRSDAVYRALGGPQGFSAPRQILRAFTERNTRALGDVDRDGKPDLVFFPTMGTQLQIARSTATPPPTPPNAPTNLRIQGSTAGSITLGWTDNSNQERAFVINFNREGEPLTRVDTAPVNAFSRTVGGLDANTRYCFTVSAESVFGISSATPMVCGRTTPVAPPTSGTFTVNLFRQEIFRGPVPFVGSFGPIAGARPLRLWRADHLGSSIVHLVRPGRSSEECFSDPSATVPLIDGGSLDQAAIADLFGGVSLVGVQITFVACHSTTDLGAPIPDLVSFNLDWGP